MDSSPRATVARFKELTEILLPARARAESWPVRLDHCFKRICLDHAFNDVWYRHLKRPAERHLAGDPLAKAVACGEEILTAGLPVLRERNRASYGFAASCSAATIHGRPPPSRSPDRASHRKGDRRWR